MEILSLPTTGEDSGSMLATGEALRKAHDRERRAKRMGLGSGEVSDGWVTGL